MSKKTKWIIVGIAFIFLLLISFFIRGNAKASFTLPVCNTDHKFNCITPIPTFNPCQQKDGMQWEDDYEPCLTPTISPSPTASPSVTPTPSIASPSNTVVLQYGSTGSSISHGGNQPPPVAQCKTPFAVPIIVNSIDKGNGTVNFAWTEGQIVDKYSITYGYSPNNLNMGEDNIPGNVLNLDIHELNPRSHVWAQVQAWFRGCEESSNVYDPLVK